MCLIFKVGQAFPCNSAMCQKERQIPLAWTSEVRDETVKSITAAWPISFRSVVVVCKIADGTLFHYLKLLPSLNSPLVRSYLQKTNVIARNRISIKRGLRSLFSTRNARVSILNVARASPPEMKMPIRTSVKKNGRS